MEQLKNRQLKNPAMNDDTIMITYVYVQLSVIPLNN